MRWIVTILSLIPIALFGLNGMADLGTGAKSKGMGGVGVALPQDAFASASNPAGLVRVGCCIDVGLGYVWEKGRFQGFFTNSGEPAPRGGNNQAHGTWWPDAGIAWRYCENQSLGFAAYVRGATSTRYENRIYDTPPPTWLDTYIIYLTPSWSWQITPCVSVGVALNGLIELHRDNMALGHASVAPNQPNGTFIPSGLFDTAGGVSVRVGALFATRCGLDIGVTCATPSLSTTFRDYSGQWPRRGLFDWPAEFGIGVAFHLCSRFVIAVDWNYFLWSNTATLGNSYVLSESLSYKLGSALGYGFGWSNQQVWKIGAEWTPGCLPCLTVRAGYNFGPTPIVPEEVFPNQMTLATVEHHVTIGLSYRLGCGEVSGYYFYGFESTVRGEGRFYVFEPQGPVTTNIANQQQGAGLSYGICW